MNACTQTPHQVTSPALHTHNNCHHEISMQTKCARLLRAHVRGTHLHLHLHLHLTRVVCVRQFAQKFMH